MKLYYSPPSPFARKVRATIIELGLDEGVDLVMTDVWDPATVIGDVNPLSKVPTLVTDDDQAIYDSLVICEYLNELADGTLFPKGPERLAVSLAHALADGILDACVLQVTERRRPPELRSTAWVARQRRAVARGLASLEEGVGSWGNRLTIAQITVGCVLGYLDFRFPGDDWRSGQPGLASWYDLFSQRRSMRETEPEELPTRAAESG